MSLPINRLAARSVVATGVFALIGSGVALAPPSSAATTVRCASGSVTLTEDNASFVLRGKCSAVVVSGSNTTVVMRDVGSLTVRGAGNTVTARTVGELDVAGVGNHTLDIESARRMEVRSANQTVKVVGRVGRAFVLGQDHALRTARVRRLTVRGHGEPAAREAPGPPAHRRLAQRGSGLHRHHRRPGPG